MQRIHRVACASAGWLALAATFAANPASAQVACQQWDASGALSAVQSNDTYAHFKLVQDGIQLHGDAQYSKHVYESGCIGVACDHYEDVVGPVVGTIRGDAFEVTVYWDDNEIGVYSGQVGPQGLIVGTSYDKNDPGTRAQWHSQRVLACSGSAPVVPPPAAKPALALGRVQAPPGTPASPPKTMCESAASARARNSPAAPALEQRCREYQAAHPPLALGRVPHVGPPAPVMTICEYAASARARNSPAAPSLEKQCREYQAAHPAAAAPPGPDNSPPVPAPHDLQAVRVSLMQEGQPLGQPVVGNTVAIVCSYVLNATDSPFVRKVQAWRGEVVVGGPVGQTLPFQGERSAGAHDARVTWTPPVPGRTPISCVLNPGFEHAEANGGNNRANVLADVVGPDAPPPDEPAPVAVENPAPPPAQDPAPPPADDPPAQ